MNCIYRLYLLSAILCFTFVMQAQEGDNPNQDFWQQEYLKFDLIYDTTIQHKATRVAQILHSIQDHSTQSLGHSHHDIPILLQHYNNSFNGFVSLTPYRSEFYGVAPPNNAILGTIDWLDVLSIHEYRHIIQFSQARKSLPVKVGSILFGNLGWAGTSNLVLPNWFIEGDATWFETATTQNGRGRLSFFHNLNSTIALDGKPLPFNTALNRSLLRPNPTRYQLGYLMTKHVYEKYGLVWDDILADATSYKGILFPFRKAVKRHTGKKLKTIYQEAMMDYQTRLAKLNYRNPGAYYEPMHQTSRHGLDNHLNPMVYDNRLFAIKTSWDHTPRLIEMIDGEAKTIFDIGFNANYHFDIANDWVVWAENVPHIRRSNLGNFAIFLRNIKTKKRKRIKHETQYFAPSFSPDGSMIIASEQDSALQFWLSEMDLEGTIKTRIQGPNKGQLMFPWYNGMDKFVAVEKKYGNLQVVEYDKNSMKWDTLLGSTTEAIHHARVQDSLYVFTASFEDKDEIYALHLETKELFKLAGSKVGAYYPFLDSTNLYLSDFTRTGMNLIKLDSDAYGFDTISTQSLSSDSSFFNSTSFQYERQVLDSLEAVEPLESEPYKRWQKAINIYGWQPFTDGESAGINVLSENILDNTFVSGGYSYDFITTQSSYNFEVTYAALYPIISAKYEQFNERSFDYLLTRQDTVFIGRRPLKSAEQTLEVGLPFNFSRNRMENHRLNIQANFGFHQTRQDEFDYNNTSLGMRTTWRYTELAGSRMINPQFGVLASASYNTGLQSDNQYVHTDLNVLLPGIVNTHSLILGIDYYQQEFDLESPLVFQRLHRGDYLTGIQDGFNELNLAATYRLPLFYPNFGIGQLLFFPRVQGVLHGGVSYIDYEVVERTVNTLAADIIVETSFMDNFNVSLGFRYGYYQIDAGDWVSEFRFYTDIPILGSVFLHPNSSYRGFRF